MFARVNRSSQSQSWPNIIKYEDRFKSKSWSRDDSQEGGKNQMILLPEFSPMKSMVVDFIGSEPDRLKDLG